MFDEKNTDRTDALGKDLADLGGDLLPPPELEKAVIAGVPFRTYVRTATHVKKIVKAVLVYSLSIALFLGALLLLPRLFEGGDPVGADPTDTEARTTSSNSRPTETTVPPMTTPPPVKTEPAEPDPPVTEPVPSVIDLMQAAGCPEEFLPVIERELTDAELSSVEAFLADEKARQILGAATFARPEDIRIYGILYGQKGSEAPRAEKEAVVAKYGDESWLSDDCTKMTTAELDALLKQYVGIGMNPSLKGDYVFYLSDYDAYYIFLTDGYGVSVDNLRGWMTADGSLLVRFDGPYEDRTALLKPTADGYLIRQMIQLKGSLIDEPEVDPTPPPAVTVPPMPAFDSINSIPKADRSEVGKTVTLSLQNQCFYYYYYPGTQIERIITVELVRGANYGKLVIYRPISGVPSNRNDLPNTPVEAEIVAVAHITLAEALDAFVGANALENLHADEFVTPDALAKNPNYQQWYFSVNEGTAQNAGKVLALAGNLSPNGSAEQIYNARLISHILSRFDLTRYLYDGLVPPGTLTDADSVPKAEQTDVGKTVTLTLENKIFYYFIDTQSGKERLAVLESVMMPQNLAKITVYETATHGLDGLIAALDTAVDAKILVVSNISWEEYSYAFTIQDVLDDYIGLGELGEDEIVDLSAPAQNPHTAQWYCSVLKDGKVTALLGNLTDVGSEYLQNRFDRIESIIYRFDLANYF